MKLQAYGNCETDLRGSGMRTCDIKNFGDVVGMALLEKGTSWAIDQETEEVEFNSTTWTDKIKAMDIFPYFRIYEFEQGTPENEKATSSNGTMSLIRNGKPYYTFTFDKGSCFHKSLYGKAGQDRWDIAFLFEAGILLATNVGASKLEGFDLGMLSVETYRFLQGTDPEQSQAMLQLLDAVQFNARHTFITWEQAGFSALDYSGVIDATVRLRNTPIMAGATELNVSVSGSCNVEDAILSLDDPSQWSIGGEQATAATISTVSYDSAGYYVLTLDNPLAEGDTVRPKLGAGVSNVAEDATGNIFKGSTRVTVSVEASTP